MKWLCEDIDQWDQEKEEVIFVYNVSPETEKHMAKQRRNTN